MLPTLQDTHWQGDDGGSGFGAGALFAVVAPQLCASFKQVSVFDLISRLVRIQAIQ